MLKLQLAVLEGSAQKERYQMQVFEIAQVLEEKEAIPVVRQQIALIQEIQTEEFWKDVTLPMLENVRKKLRGLVQFLDSTGERKRVYTNFEDELQPEREFPDLIKSDDSRKNYRLKVERFVRQHVDHPTIHRLKHNEPITIADLAELESILFSAEGPGSRETFNETYGTDQPLGKLIREIVGLDPNTAKVAFADFLGRGTLSADQITFIN